LTKREIIMRICKSVVDIAFLGENMWKSALPFLRTRLTHQKAPLVEFISCAGLF